ncbi:DgyrCDS13925 [Dimorphilus gyrociliatus]|uniref:DgyrCDS13925 n=1 Tax=Dimorphilus gyrociliatus TaxID=2664684 RepID=A0A7I8WC18_9ANNE|nr:DgyrCDS13925 [Dimorphilus gyrociliatus]
MKILPAHLSAQSGEQVALLKGQVKYPDSNAFAKHFFEKYKKLKRGRNLDRNKPKDYLFVCSNGQVALLEVKITFSLNLLTQITTEGSDGEEMSTADLEGLPEAVTGATGPLTIRMVMQGKEVGSIIGKKGDNVKKYREESGAKINISDASCPERIVTVSGSSEGIYKAFTMICKKFEEDINAQHGQSALPKPPVTIRLVVPASQCGSLIGKAGAKIKEIRDATGASIQVASEMLPNSTERAVTISGSADQITQCIFHICAVMLESPPKGATIPYRPKPILPPGLMAVAAGGAPAASFLPAPSPTVFFPPSPDAAHLHKLALQPQTMLPPGAFPFIGQSLLPGAATSIQPGVIQSIATGLPTGSVSLRPNAPIQNGAAQTHEMTIPNDLIGCIIGRGGAKINEIRQLSGAQIKIANADESLGDRKVTITGTPDTVQAAQYLINARLLCC